MASMGYIQVTRTCNQKCVFCSNPYVEDTLSLEDAKNQIDYYIEKCGVNNIILTGGEPTLHPHLDLLIRYIVDRHAAPKIISNGQKLSDITYVKKLIDAGLQQFIISIYSHKAQVHEKLTTIKGSHKNVLKALDNISKFIDVININITLCSANYKDMPDTVQFLIKKYPAINHFVFNNLDPTGRAINNLWTVPKLNEIELPLIKTINVLKHYNKTFRIERVPLCYMHGFEEFSTETRRIVKNQVYRILFLDQSGRRYFEKKDEYYYPDGKSESCKHCYLNKICAGLNTRYAQLYGYDELYPVFDNPEIIIAKIK